MSVTFEVENRLEGLLKPSGKRLKSNFKGLGLLTETEVRHCLEAIDGLLQRRPKLVHVVINQIDPEPREQLSEAIARYDALKVSKCSAANQLLVVRGRGPVVIGGRRKQMKTIIERDGDRCAWCSAKLSYDHPDASLDHIVPHCQGGAKGNYNMVLACGACNNKRGETDAVEWIAVCKAKGLAVQSSLIWDRLLETLPRYERLYEFAI